MPAQHKMADGSREVSRVWRYQDPSTGQVTEWAPGDPYTGPEDLEWLDHPQGPDGRGPLLKPPAPHAKKSPPNPSSDSSVKEK